MFKNIIKILHKNTYLKINFLLWEICWGFSRNKYRNKNIHCVLIHQRLQTYDETKLLISSILKLVTNQLKNIYVAILSKRFIIVVSN